MGGLRAGTVVAFLCFFMIVVTMPTSTADDPAPVKVDGYIEGPPYVGLIGHAEIDDLLFLEWASQISITPGMSPTMLCMLVRPNGSMISLVHCGPEEHIIDMTGDWRFRCEVTGDFLNASVQYRYELIHPKISVTSLGDNAYTNSSLLMVSGPLETYVSNVSVSLDNVSFTEANLNPTSWEVAISLSEGENTFYLRERYSWWVPWGVSSFGRNYTFGPFVVNLDQTEPNLIIHTPNDGACIRGDEANISWVVTDDTAIETVEVSIDGGPWTKPDNPHYMILKTGTGGHSVMIRAIDKAGNQIIHEVTFETDNRALSFGGPYFGIPIVAGLVGGVAAGLLVFLIWKRAGSHRGG